MTRDGGQQHQRQGRREDEVDQHPDGASSDEAAAELRDRQDKLSDDVDAILDEIDGVLEENAEEFVRGFVQKGGQ